MSTPTTTQRPRSRTTGPEPVLITVHEAAAILGVSHWTVYRIIRTDPSFPAVHLGHRVRVHTAKLDQWLEVGGTARVVDAWDREGAKA